jgi:phage gp16-like protein
MTSFDDARRRAELRLIHLGAKKLGMDDGSYRLWLRNLTGEASAALLSSAERAVAIEDLRRRGFQHKAPAAAGEVKPLAEAQHRMARGLWIDLWRAGVVRDRRDSALHAFVKRVTGVERLEWLSIADSNKVIEALKAMRDRAEGVVAEKDGDGLGRTDQP